MAAKRLFLLLLLALSQVGIALVAQPTTIDSLKQALKTEKKQIDQGQIAILLIEKYARKNLDSSFFFANQALELANHALQKAPNSIPANGLKGAALFNTAVLNHQTSVYEKAKTYYIQAIDYLKKGEELDLLAKNISYLGRIYEREGNPELFRQKTLEAIRIQETQKNFKGLAYSYTSLGDYYARKNDHDSSEICYKKVFEFHKKTDNQRGLAFSLQNYGGRLKARREYPKAIKNFYKALAIQKKINDKSGMLYTLMNIGSVHKDLKEFDKASKYYQEALEVNQIVKDKSVEAKLLFNQGDLFSDQEKPKKSIEKYQEALDLMREIKIGPNMIANCLTDLAKENIKVKKYAEASNLIDEALQLGRNISMPEDLGTRHITKAAIKIELNALTTAELHLDSAIGLGEQANLKEILSEGYLMKSKLAEKNGHFEDAMTFLKIHNQFKDSLNLISTERLLLKKEANYQIEQSKKENELNLIKIDLLKREKKLNSRLIVGLIGLMLALVLLGFFMFKNYKQKKEAKEIEVKNQLKMSNSELSTLRERVNTMLLADKGKLDDLAISSNVNQFLDEPLSQRELDVLNELSTGKSNQEISDALFVSVNTVRTHLLNIYHKLDVKNRTQAVKKAANLNQNM